MLTLAKLTQKNVLKIAETTGVPQLLTIPYSHYVEFARWSLDHHRVEHEERPYAPVQHVLPMLKLRLCGEKRHLAPGSTSSNRNSKKGNPTAVPALALPDGSVLADSWSIASHASGGSVGLSFDDPRRQFLDSQFGPDTRQLCYAWLLKPENTNVWNALATNSRFGSFWKTLWSWGLGSKVSSRLVSLFKTDDAEEVLNVSRRITGHFEQMSSRLRARPGKYLNGDELSIEDIAFCALAAPVVMPPEFCRGWFKSELDLLLEQDNAIHEQVEQLRATEAGQYVLEIYRTQRMPHRVESLQ